MASSLAALFLAANLAFALPVDAPLPDTAQEARAKAMFYEIRCVVCAGESIADSPAEVASDMRRAVREHIAAGDSDAAIKADFIARYGESVLMRPPLMRATLLLWFGPLLLLTLAGAMAARYFRKAA